MSYNLYPYELKPLPYAYDALEPFIDELTMKIHHDRHLATYVNNLNNALKGYPELQKMSLEQLLYYNSKLPAEIRTAVKNNAGGVFNHNLYFDCMQNPQTITDGVLMQTLIRDYASFDNFKAEFKKQALSVFGSGYTWLVYANNKLHIMNTANQDTPLAINAYPLMLLDVWEHAYYLKHYNMRADYIDNWFALLNWERLEKEYKIATTGHA